VHAVVEAVGDHGCEYMTGGRVIVLGPAGRNFGAGMSGGVAYVLDDRGDFSTKVNREMVDVGPLQEPEEIAAVRAMIERHLQYTKSARAQQVLDSWDERVTQFVRVMPRDYKRMLECIARAHDQGLTGEDAIMAAFEENARDLSRVGGN
jgi:glutamate synthase (ferredoxin)